MLGAFILACQKHTTNFDWLFMIWTLIVPKEFYGERGTHLLDIAICEYWCNKFLFSAMHPIVIPIQWRV